MKVLFLRSTQGKESLSDWLPAFVVSFSYICGCIGIGGISIVLAFFLWIMVGCEVFLRKYKMKTSLFAVVFAIIIIFSFSFIRVPAFHYIFDYFERFLLFDVVALFIGTQSINKESVLRKTTLIGVILLPLLMVNDFFASGSGAAMGISYACLPILLASAIEFTITGELSFKMMSAINVLCIMYKYMVAANRGVWVIIASFVLLMFYIRIAKSGIAGLRRIKAFLFLALAGIVAIYGLMNLEQIVGALYDFLDKVFHIQIYALWKIQFYLQKGDVMNGRSELANMAIEVIKHHPLAGSGIGYFEILADGGYCHNIVLQVLCEGGVICFIPMLWYILSALRNIMIKPLNRGVNNRDYEIKLKWGVLIFCVGIEMLFFSSVYWMWMPFWFFLGTYLNDRKEQRFFTNCELLYCVESIGNKMLVSN